MPTASEIEIQLLHRLRQNNELLREIADASGTELSLQQRLRASHDPELVRAALGLVEARVRAKGKLPMADELWLTRVGLEQSTAWAVAQHKSRRFPEGAEVYDLCSGIGVDSAALLSRGGVISVDVDPAMALRCQWNMDVWQRSGNAANGRNQQHITADIREMNFAGSLMHVDPDRRAGRDRPVKRLEQYSPDLSWMQSIVRQADGGALKLGPASNFMQKFPGCEIELISEHGECREATVWFGGLAGESSFRATVLPSGESITADPLSAWCPTADRCLRYIFDPDPAVVRSGLLDVLGEMHNMRRMDKSDEYMTADAVPTTSLVMAYQVEAVLTNNPRELKSYLQRSPSRDYEIKCRHLKVDASALQRQLPRGEGPVKVLLFVRLNGKAAVVVATRSENAKNVSTLPVDGAGFPG